MKRVLWLISLLWLIGTLGCGSHDGSGLRNDLAVFPTPVAESGTANLDVVFVLPGGEGPRAAILPEIINGTVRVTFILKVLNEGNVDKPYIELRKEIPVVNGVATASFAGLTPHSLIGEIQIVGGTKSGFANFHGGVDLQAGSNTIEVAPVGSKLGADLLATAMKDLTASATLLPYVKPNLAALLRQAITTTTGQVGTDSAMLTENLRQVYLMQNTTTASTKANPFIDSGSKYMESYQKYAGMTYQAPPSGSVRGAIRAGTNFWDWDAGNEMWSVYYPGLAGASKFYAFWFADPAGAHFSSLSESSAINQFITGSVIKYLPDWYGNPIKLTEVYVYNFLDGFSKTSYLVRIGGYAQAVYDSDTPEELYRIDSDVLCNVKESYPLGGTVTVTRSDGSGSKITFDGTCVARYDVTYADGSSEVFRVMLGRSADSPAPSPPPAAPTGLTITPGVGQFTLAWNPVANADSYRLYVRTIAGVTKFNGTLFGTVSNPLTITGVTPGADYYYVVTAVNLSGESSESNEVYGTPKTLPAWYFNLGNEIKMWFLEMPPGSFQMGSLVEDPKRDADETQHEVSFAKTLFMGQVEVTQEQWWQIMGDNPSYFSGANLPVERITWFEATEFCNALSNAVGRTPCYSYDSSNQYQCDWSANGFRLPTEAEWEYACRAGTTNTYFWGSTGTEEFSKLFAWFSANADGTNPVAQKSPNAWGFYDMVGNVWEWCWDYYGADYYSVSPATDPHGPDTGTDVVIRGNSWYETDWATYNRPSFRYYYGKASYDIGFRVCYHD